MRSRLNVIGENSGCSVAQSEADRVGIAHGSADRYPGRDCRYTPRSMVFREGDEAHSIFQVLEGAVMLYKLLPDGRRQVVELLSAGDVFGFSPRSVRDCFAETLLETRCLVLHRDVVERSPALMRWLTVHLRLQLCALHDHVTLLGRKSAMERLASFLMRHVPGRGRDPCPGPPAGDDDAVFRLTLMRQEIADYLGLTIETVSRLLTELKRRGIVKVNKLDELFVYDVCELCRLTGTHLTLGHSCSSRAQGFNKPHPADPS